MKTHVYSLLALMVTLMTISALSYAQQEGLACEEPAARVEASPSLVKSSAAYVSGSMTEIEQINADRSLTDKQREAEIDEKLMYSLQAANATQSRLLEFKKLRKQLQECKAGEKK